MKRKSAELPCGKALVCIEDKEIIKRYKLFVFCEDKQANVTKGVCHHCELNKQEKRKRKKGNVLAFN